MAIIKKSEFNQMNDTQLEEKLVDLKKELVKFRTQISTGTPPENPGRTRAIRKTIAKIYTRLTVLKTQPKIEANKTTKKEEAKEVKKAEKKPVKKVTKKKSQSPKSKKTTGGSSK